MPSGKQLLWLVPDRDTADTSKQDAGTFWAAFGAAAEKANIEYLGVHSVDSIQIDASEVDESPRVFLDGRKLEPSETIAMTALYTFPYQVRDIWEHLSLFVNMEHAGFRLPVPTKIAVEAADKLATTLAMRKIGIPTIPTVRFGAGRRYLKHDFKALLRGLSFPLALKPAYWAGGIGFNVAWNVSQLERLVSLASGAETALVVQPLLDVTNITDYRVVCIEGVPKATWARRPADGGLVSNLTHGGRGGIEDVPSDLNPLASAVAGYYNIPYLCVDFLKCGSDIYFSEIEPDGGLPEWEPEAKALIDERVKALKRWHDSTGSFY